MALLLCALAPALSAEATWSQQLFKSLGGQERLLAINTIEVEARGNNYSHMYNHDPDGSPQHLSDDTVTSLWQPGSGALRIHTKISTFFPFVGQWDYVEAYDGRAATRAGPEEYRPGDDGKLEPPYVGAALKRLALFHPHILLARARNIVAAGERRHAGRNQQLLYVEAFEENWRVYLDAPGGLPRAIEVAEPDGMMGEIIIRVEYGDWRDVDGIKMPFRVEQFADGVLNRREIRTRMSHDSKSGNISFSVADAGMPVEADLMSRGWQHAHWFNDRAAMTRPTETRRETPVIFEEVGTDVFQLAGTSHNNLVIVGETSLVVVDAPLGPERSEDVLAAIARRWPDKPVRYLVLTHHHIDHSAGYGPYLEAGAQLVVGAPIADYFFRAVHLNTGRAPDILSISNRTPLPGFNRPVEAIPVPNSHARGMLVVHALDTNIVFVTDLYSAGRPQQNPLYKAELFSALRFEGIGAVKLVGGHGRGTELHDPAAD